MLDGYGIMTGMNALTVIWVALGSAAGGVCRYLVSHLLNAGGGFPWGTLTVNVVGSLAIGALSGWLAHQSAQATAIRLFAVVGFCGGFTTFSTFSNEAFRLLEQSQWGLFAGYVGASVVAGLAAVALGYSLAR